jgi:DNA (cytosine-5)-methyltransferase 1
MTKYKLSEFCSGTGAFSIGFESTGNVETIYANDIEPNSKKIFDVNNNLKLTLQDIHTIDSNLIPRMDIMTSGFPCQPFSLAGNKGGFQDIRSNVFWKLIEIMNHHKPICVVFENVKNIISHDNGNTFRVITDKITEIGYKFKYKVINTCKFTDIPQNRERVYIVCFKNENHYNTFEFPLDIDDTIEIKDLLLQNVSDKYYYKNTSRIYNTLLRDVTKNINTNTIYQYRRHYVRENMKNLCPTLTANMGTGGHNVPIIRDDNGIRKLTPRECFILQGFSNEFILPDNMSDSALYKLVGNAITVKVITKIAKEIIKTLDK